MTRRRTAPMETQPWPSAEVFDGWYAAMSGSPVRDEIQRRHLGLPPRLLSTSLLGWAAIAEVAEALRLSPGDTMLGVACGRGAAAWRSPPAPGPSWCGWTSRPRRCGGPASTHGSWAAPRGFRLGNLAATGLGDGSVDAVLCGDAIQFSQQPDAACCELPRVLGPGGRGVLTCWEPLGRGDERLPGRLRRVDLAARLTAVGFTSMEVRGRLGWRACERAIWQEPATLDPPTTLRWSHSTTEGMRSLEILDLTGGSSSPPPRR